MPAVKDTDDGGQGGPVFLSILVPSTEYWPADFAMSLMALQQLLGYQPLADDFRHNLINERGSLIAYQRENLADKALAEGATHLLWLDSDMKFPPSLVHQLFRHDLPVVACNYVKRKIPAMPNSKRMDGKLIATNRNSHGLEEASSAGFGAVLMKREVLESVPKPWFDTVWLRHEDGSHEMVGEDVFFFRKARQVAGVPLYVDHDASQHVAHIGTFEYENALCAATWEEVDCEDAKAVVMGDEVRSA